MPSAMTVWKTIAGLLMAVASLLAIISLAGLLAGRTAGVTTQYYVFLVLACLALYYSARLMCRNVGPAWRRLMAIRTADREVGKVFRLDGNRASMAAALNTSPAGLRRAVREDNSFKPFRDGGEDFKEQPW